MENDWRKVREIFNAALERGPEERDDFLAEACGNDKKLLAEVESQVYAALGDFDNAFRVLRESLDRREGFMFGYANFLVLDRLKSDPRWQEVSRRINRPA